MCKDCSIAMDCSIAFESLILSPFTTNAGDVTLKGATISTVPGHRTIRKIFVSPSICYCTYGEVYSKSKM